VFSAPDPNTAESHKGSTQRLGGPSVETAPSDTLRMGSVGVKFLVGSSTVSLGSPSGRPFRQQVESSAATFLLPMPGPPGDGSRRDDLGMAERNTVCLPFMGKTLLVTNGLGTFKHICLTALEQAPDSGDGDDCLLCPVRTLRY
jgi:hypothetical protein